jgi:hypothetical protein
MASGLIKGTTGNEYIDSKIEWTSKLYSSTNMSYVGAALFYRRNNTGYTTYGTGSFSITINGQKTSKTATITITDEWTLAMSVSDIAVDHDTDGAKTITISATGSISGTTLTSTTCSGKVDLDTNTRKSTITSASDKLLGNKCAITWTPNSTSAKFKLKFSLGDWSYTTGYISPGTTSEYTYTGYKLPLDVAEDAPISGTEDTMSVTLYTYVSSTLIGSSSTTFTVTVPPNSSLLPSVSMTLTPVSSLGSPFSSLYIQGKSKVKATFSGEGKYGADISSYRLYVQNYDYGSPYQSAYITRSGTVTVTGRATDSRGYYNETEEDISVIPYGKPSLLPASDEDAIICARCDADGNLSESGTYLKIKARRSYYKVTSGGVQKNFCAIRYRCVTEGKKFSGDEGWVTLLSGSTTSTDTINKTMSGVVSSAETAYVVQVGVIDDIGESDTVQFIIPTDFVTLDIPEAQAGKRIGLLRYARDSSEPGIDVGAPIYGGSVDSLKLGTRLTATEASPLDLNDYKTPGCYYSPNAENSKYISHTPYTGGGFGLEVREIQSANYIRQEMYYGRTRWSRHWNTSEWSEWLRFLISSSDADTVEDFVIEEAIFQTDYGFWFYKKWLSGTYQMFGQFDVTPTESNLHTSVYRTNSITIPSPFTLTNAIVSGSVMGYAWISNGGVSTDHESVAFRLISDEELSTTSTIDVRLIVMGRYE